MKVDHHDGYLAAGYHQDDKHQEEEPEHVVELILIDRWEYEEQLDEAGAERKDARHHGADHRVHVPDLRGNLSGDLVGSHGVLVWLFSVSEEISEEYQRQGDSKPHCYYPDDCHEGDGSTGVFAPDEEIDEESDPEDNWWIEGGGEEGCSLRVK